MTNSTYAYCPNCKNTRRLKRKDFEVCLSIILLIFTGGIGFIVYLIYYYSRPKDHCSFCDTIIPKRIFISQIEEKEHLEHKKINYSKEKNTDKNQIDSDKGIIQGEKIRYCIFCGGELKEDSKFCSFCGSKV